MAKQLFNSSDKTNFIMNLTEEKYAKIVNIVFVMVCFCMSIAMSVPLILDEKLYMILSLALSVVGVVGIIAALIGILKKYIGKRIAVPLCGVGVLFVWGIFSMLNSYDKFDVSIYGFPGRCEGLMAIAFYICFFITAASVKRESAIKTLIWGILGNGLLNSGFALYQVFTGEMNDYHLISKKIILNAAAGLSQSPLFLAMVLSISIAAALMGAVIFTEKWQKLLCIVSAALFSFVIMFTFSLIGICGAVLAIIVTIVMIFISKAPKINMLSVLAVIVPAVASVLIVQAGAVGTITEYKLYDGRLLWFDDSYMRLSSSGNYDPDYVDIDNTFDVYYTLNRKTCDIISKYALTGTGPDQLLYPQLYTYGPTSVAGDPITEIAIFNKGTFDRVYNEYLYVAATRGIPSAVALVVTLLSAVIIGFASYKRSRNPLILCMAILTAMGMLIFLIGCGNTAFSPIYWSIAGASCCALKNDKRDA